MGPLAALTLLLLVVAAAALGRSRVGRFARAVGRSAGRAATATHLSRPEEPRPLGRPIELIADDARRLGGRFHHVPPGASFARFEARRQAYDTVLAEACQVVAVDHLLLVIPPGPELDAERARVESVLLRSGFALVA